MKRCLEPPPNHDRWLISYADFMTLMFALFVAMYAMSLKDHNSAKRVAASIREAIATGGLASAVHTFLAKEPVKTQTNPETVPHDKSPGIDPGLREPFQRLSKELKKQIDTGAIRLHLEARGLVITLEEKTFFPSGDSAIFQLAYPSLEKVAQTIAELANPVRLEGHTDSVPIHTARFQNNWELSTSRSIALLQLFETKYGLDASRFAVAGYAQNLPVASNDTEAGRARNRRVEIVILGWQNAPTDSAHR